MKGVITMPQYDIDSGITNTLYNNSQSFSFSEVWMIISVLLAVIGGIFLFATYFNKDKEETYTGFKKTLYDFVHFKLTIIEPIFRILYLISAIALTLSSLSYLTVNFFEFIGILVFGNIAIRLLFELLLLTLKLFKDVSEINCKIPKKSSTPKQLAEKNKNVFLKQSKDTSKKNEPKEI